MGKEVRHEKKCKPFKTARDAGIIKCMTPDVTKPTLYYLDFVDPDRKTAEFLGVMFERKTMLVCNYCPFCGKGL